MRFSYNTKISGNQRLLEQKGKENIQIRSQTEYNQKKSSDEVKLDIF